MPAVEMVDRLRAWSHFRQRLGDPARSVEDALRAVVAVYATHPTCPLALAARTRSLTADRYRRIDRDRKGLRIPAMRKTLFLLPREQAGRVFAAVRLSPAQALRSLKRHDLSTKDYNRIAKKCSTRHRTPSRRRTRELGRASGASRSGPCSAACATRGAFPRAPLKA